MVSEDEKRLENIFQRIERLGIIYIDITPSDNISLRDYEQLLDIIEEHQVDIKELV
jgi:sugar phosphate isomerase/epimerase